ncbi:hypothetical protein SAMN05518672_103197 [Chitinophaga sp. CF118]|uniref:hypothetical protein n=1 Tax=Chitinophaga sp. CF118 TaxID=1884367 RepID=UPI0008EB2653|nr:hypothetical protein [Chitinophaga sp. CF118]SFD78250.1 hypothetical protein SAMN05518672_103197 [Chitinophaga sp. CF118]
MPNFNLRWVNRSRSKQDWMISNGDSFTLQPNFERSVNLIINNDYTFRIVVSTRGGYAHADLTYSAHTNSWTLTSLTPNEWGLAQGNGIVTVRCFLEDVFEAYIPMYAAQVPEFSDEEEKVKYPAYQLYEDNTDTTYCSPKKVLSHAVGNLWIKACLAAHPGTSCNGKPWISDDQDGTIWPE